MKNLIITVFSLCVIILFVFSYKEKEEFNNHYLVGHYENASKTKTEFYYYNYFKNVKKNNSRL